MQTDNGVDYEPVAFRFSDNVDKLFEALHKAQHAITPVPKTKTNPHFGSKYADLATVWEHVREPLKSNGLFVLQGSAFLPGPDAKHLPLATRLCHTSGQWVETWLKLPLAKENPQGVGAGVTYARRFLLGLILGVTTDDDDDGEGAVGRRTRTRDAEDPGPTPKPADEPLTSLVRGVDVGFTKADYFEKESQAIGEGEVFEGKPRTAQRTLFAWECALFDIVDPLIMGEIGKAAVDAKVPTRRLHSWLESEIERRQAAEQPV